MKKSLAIFTIVVFWMTNSVLAETHNEDDSGFFENAGDWISGVTSDVWDWTTDAAEEAWDWTTETAETAWDWTTDAAVAAWGWTVETASNVWKWTSDTANEAWNGVEGFFNPPSTDGTPTIIPEPELPVGTQKMYLGYEVQRTGLDNGYADSKSIGRDDPHFGLTLSKFYISGFTSAISEDGKSFIFLKNVGDDVELHFELVQDIDMLGGDTFVTINEDIGGYEKYFGIKPTNMGRGTLIVRHTDYQNNPGEPQIYTDYLTAKTSGSADTVISLKEEGDYEVALVYEIKEDSYIMGTAATSNSYTNYRVYFKFSVRNGNCMIFPKDTVTGAELRNTSVTENGFVLDLAYSRYLNINVKYSVLTDGASGIVEDIRYNRPASDGEKYTEEGIYTITVGNRYTGEITQKQMYVGTDERLMDYVNKGYSVEQMIEDMENN